MRRRKKIIYSVAERERVFLAGLLERKIMFQQWYRKEANESESKVWERVEIFSILPAKQKEKNRPTDDKVKANGIYIKMRRDNKFEFFCLPLIKWKWKKERKMKTKASKREQKNNKFFVSRASPTTTWSNSQSHCAAAALVCERANLKNFFTLLLALAVSARRTCILYYSCASKEAAGSALSTCVCWVESQTVWASRIAIWRIREIIISFFFQWKLLIKLFYDDDMWGDARSLSLSLASCAHVRIMMMVFCISRRLGTVRERKKEEKNGKQAFVKWISI